MLYQLGFKILALQTFSFTFMCNVEQQIKKPEISDYIYFHVKLELSSFSLTSVVFQNYPDHDIPVKKTKCSSLRSRALSLAKCVFLTCLRYALWEGTRGVPIVKYG